HVLPKQIAVFAQDDAYGDAGFAGVARAIRDLGETTADPLRFNYKRNTIDVADAVAKLGAQRGAIKAVVMVATYRAAAKFIERTRDAFPSLIYTNLSFVGSTQLAYELKLLGPKYSDGVIVTQVVPDVNGYSSLALRYRAALQKYAAGEAPDYVSFEGYVDMQVLAEGLRRAGRNLTTETLVDALEAIKGLDIGLGAKIGFGPEAHQASDKVWGTMLDKDAHYQPLSLN
ncbi:MAG: ABC transporter substrate-binding protein, partial [Hyphomicrobiales bacterium]|nr:ABC transporter substrate-binding protein [Hyphomicrobiales bacterium]